MSPLSSFIINSFLTIISNQQGKNNFVFKPHPESYLSLEQIISKNGYPVEIHTVESKDNYFITVYRIPYGKKPDKFKSRSPVIILHGMGGTAEHYTNLGKDRALVYYLADRGFDVWLICTRGTPQSFKHRFYDWDRDLEYWEYSFHEVGVYDLAGIIDYAISKTGHKKVFFIGQSSGTTCFFTLASHLKEYNDKIKIAVHYGPSAILKYINVPFVRVFTSLRKQLDNLRKNIGIGYFPPATVNSVVNEIATYLCSEINVLAEACLQLMNSIGSNDSFLTDRNITNLVLSTIPTRVSLKQVIHFLQLIETGFRQYDYGSKGNLKVYGTKHPPGYNLTNCVSKNVLMWGKKDDLTAEKGTLALLEILTNAVDYKIPFEQFNHIDFIFARNASKLVYEPTVNFFKAYDEGRVPENIRDFKL